MRPPSPEARRKADAFGQAVERAVRMKFERSGDFVVPVHAIQDGGAPAVVQALRRYVLPDLLTFRSRAARWVEVKGKDHPTVYRKLWEHGVDWRNWNDYLAVEDQSGIPGYLAIVELRPRQYAPPAPVLLLAPFATLRRFARHFDGIDRRGLRFDMAFWSRDRFQIIPGLSEHLERLPELEPTAPPARKGPAKAPRRPPTATQQELPL